MNFYVAIIILKMEENKQDFQHIMLYYFKKGKNVTEMQKEIYMEKMLWLIKYVKSGMWSFLLEICHWTKLYSQVDQLKLIVSKSRH